MVNACEPAPRRQKQRDGCKLRTSLVYLVRTGTARTTSVRSDSETNKRISEHEGYHSGNDVKFKKFSIVVECFPSMPKFLGSISNRGVIGRSYFQSKSLSGKQVLRRR